MGEPAPAVTIPSSETLDIDAIRSQIRDIKDRYISSNDATEPSTSEVQELSKTYALQLEKSIDQILSEFSNVSSLAVDDLDAYYEHLKQELITVEADNANISNEIDDLSRAYVEDCSRLEGELEGLNCSLDFISSKDLEKAKANVHVNCPTHGEDPKKFSNANGDCTFKILELSHQIDSNDTTLKSLRDLDCILKRLEAIHKVEDTLTGIQVIEFEGNFIKLALKTFIPTLESLACLQRNEDISEPLEQNHELSIEVIDGTMELKNIEIFPNDVYIGEIVEAAKSFKSSLEWIVRRVQHRIVLCTLRRFVVKCANKSRHSFEYLDRDELIVAHMVGGVDAFIKVSQGWPVSNAALKLKTLKSSGQYSKEISLSFLCKVEEVANSLDAPIRQSISSFVDAIEEILVQRMHAELQDDKTGKRLLSSSE